MDYDTKTLLVRHALLSVVQVVNATLIARGRSSTWLEQLLLVGTLDEEQLCACIGDETCLPRCRFEQLAHVRSEVLTSLPAEVAIEHRLMPLELEPDGSLRVAMVDPFDASALEEVRFFTGRNLVREVALASSIAWAHHHYFGAPIVLWPRTAQGMFEASTSVSRAGPVIHPQLLRTFRHA